MASKFPDRGYIGQAMSFTVEHGLMSRSAKNVGNRQLGRFTLPPFQRDLVWTPKQQSLFIESLWLGLPISVYAYSQSETPESKTDNWLIDGQQRWTAIHAFVADQVAVFGGMRHSDMSNRQQRGMLNIVFPAILIRSDDEAYLEDMYNRLAYGGTPHK